MGRKIDKENCSGRTSSPVSAYISSIDCGTVWARGRSVDTFANLIRVLGRAAYRYGSRLVRSCLTTWMSLRASAVSVLAGLVVLSVAVPRVCTDCGLCTRACPALLPVATSLRVGSSECTGCLDRVAVCPAPGALDPATPRPWRRVVRPV